MMGWIRVTGFAVAVLLCICSFFAGGVVGMIFGDFNARMDFCDDNSSPRFIADEEARRAACDRRIVEEEH